VKKKGTERREEKKGKEKAQPISLFLAKVEI